MKCSSCGKEIAEDSKFCEYCGVQVKEYKNLDLARLIRLIRLMFKVLLLSLLLKSLFL